MPSGWCQEIGDENECRLCKAESGILGIELNSSWEPPLGELVKLDCGRVERE